MRKFWRRPASKYSESIGGQKRYLVVYDYGNGGFWRFLTGGSRQQIEEMFPALKVIEKRPTWLTAKEEAEIKTVDIDDETDWFVKRFKGNRNPN